MELKTTFNVKSDYFSLFILLFKVQDELEAVKTLAVLEPFFRNVSFPQIDIQLGSGES